MPVLLTETCDLCHGSGRCPGCLGWCCKCGGFATKKEKVVSEEDECLTVAELREALQKVTLAFQTPMYMHGMYGWLIWPPRENEDPVKQIMRIVREDVRGDTPDHPGGGCE